MWTTVARTKRRGGRKIPTPTSFGSAPPLSASEFGAFRYGFFNSVGYNSSPAWPSPWTYCGFQPRCCGVQPRYCGVQPSCCCVQPSCCCVQPRYSGVKPEYTAGSAWELWDPARAVQPQYAAGSGLGTAGSGQGAVGSSPGFFFRTSLCIMQYSA
jgi:hypothetical protein